MNAKIQKWGNSLALRIPKALAEESHLTDGSTVDINVHDGKLVVVSQRPPQYKLTDLLKKVTPRNIHGEIHAGGPVGKEVLL